MIYFTLKGNVLSFYAHPPKQHASQRCRSGFQRIGQWNNQLLLVLLIPFAGNVLIFSFFGPVIFAPLILFQRLPRSLK